jgi:hypothetical protein
MNTLKTTRLKSSGLSYTLPALICALTVVSASMLTASIIYPITLRSRGVEEAVDSVIAIHNAIESIAYRVSSSTTIYVNTPPEYPVIIDFQTVKCVKNIFLKNRIISDPKGIVDIVDDYGVKYSGIVVNSSGVIAGPTRATLTCIGVVDGKSIISLKVANITLSYKHLNSENTLKQFNRYGGE